ncbi:MAG: hypothetical protein AAB268_02655 [Elusimicrobiota bacterium]
MTFVSRHRYPPFKPYAFLAALGLALAFWLFPASSSAGVITALPYTNVSANSLTANWSTSFAGGTVYQLRISTDAFATVNSISTTTNANFFFGGLFPAATYEVRVSTDFTGVPFTSLGMATTPSAAGGSIGFNFSSGAGGAVIASANGQNEMGLGVLVDPISGGGPYAYVIFASTPGATGARNIQHDTAGVIAIARYDSNATMISSRTVAIDSKGGFARDDAGNIYVAETDRSLGSNSRWISKYSANLSPLSSRVLSGADFVELGPMISTGTSIFSLLEDGNDATVKIVNYDSNLVAVATAAAYSLGGNPVKGHGMARDGFGGYLYVLVSSGTPNAPVHLLKYPAVNPGVFNAAAAVVDAIIPGLTKRQHPRVAFSAGKVYVAFTDVPGANIFVREYNQSLGYTGFSSTITNVTAPFGMPSLAIEADGTSVLVAGTVYTGGGGDYLVMKYDANNGLAFVSSATFNSPTYLPDQVSGLAVGPSGDVYVTGASSNTISDANAVTMKFAMGAGGGAAGAVSSAPYTSVSTTSFIANWNTNFVSGTVYDLQISTNGFVSINFQAATTGDNFSFSGLLPATTYEVRVSTTGGAGPFTQLGVVATLGAGISISGIVAYTGLEPGEIRVEAYTSSACTGIPASSQVLSNVPFQSYYLPVGAGTFYVRAYVDTLGGGNYRTWLDQATIGPVTLVASSDTGRDFSIAVDSQAPNSPLGLSASPSAGQVFLSWAAPTTNTEGSALQDLRGYIIRRSTGASGLDLAGSPEAPISSGSLTFTDFSPVPGVINIYNVIAVDFARNQSAPSASASVSESAGGSGGAITGHISSFTATTSGTYRVRLSSTSLGTFISESNQEYYSFSGLSTGTYFVSGFRDLNENGIQDNFEPAGLFGGMNNNPYPIYVFGANSSLADITLCDRSLLQVGAPVSDSLQLSDCPARDAGPDRFTHLLAFEAGTGSAGSVSLGTALTISMSQIDAGNGDVHDSRLIVLGPNGQILADNSSPGGASVSLTPNATGVYVVEPTSFYGFSTGAYSVTMDAGASGLATDGIYGTLSYTGSQTGAIVVRFFTNSSFSGVPVATMSVAASSGSVSGLAFDKRYLPMGTYFVDAFRDTSGFGFNPVYQAYGKCNAGGLVVLNGGAPLVDIGSCALADPVAAVGAGSGSISGVIAYNGSLSATTIRTSLFALGGDVPVQSLATVFTPSMPYSFTALPAGSYRIKAFADVNGNFVPDADEEMALSSAAGINLQDNVGLSAQNLTLCDRSAIADGVPMTVDLTTTDCPAADRAGAFMKMVTFSGTRGQSVTINAIAQNFYGTFLALYDPEGDLVATNDGASDGNASIAEFELPLDGLYTIGASPYAPGVTGKIELSFAASNGAVGSIAGDVDYQGTQGGRITVGLFDSPSFSSSSFIDSRVLISTRNFLFSNLFAGSSYYLGAFVDVNFNDNPDQGEDKAFFGDTSASPIFLGSGQNVTGASIIISASTVSVAGASYLTGSVFYGGAQTGQLILEFWAGAQFFGRPVAVRNIPSGIVLSSAAYDVSLPGGVNYFVRAFLDVNGDFIPNPSEPNGVYSPNDQGAAPIYVPAGQTLLGINVAMRDPGQTSGGAIAGEGTAVITNTSISAGLPFSLSVVYTAGATGIQPGGKVGMTVPPGFPFPLDSIFSSSITARSGAALSAVNYSGPSVFVTLASALLPGATVGFEWSNVFAPCAVGAATFTVTSVSDGTGAPAPLFGGSPSVPVVAGSAVFFQLSSSYFSVKEGVLSDINYLQSRDSCGTEVPLTLAHTVDLRGTYYNTALSQFSLDADVGLTTGTAVSTASAIAVDFEIGQSSRPFFLVCASTGFKNLEVHYNLLSDTTFYFGLSALPGNALGGVFVSTTPGVTALSSATISLGAAGLTNQVFIGFTLGDPQQSWRVLFSSIPFKPGVPPTPVWELWGYGQTNPGAIAWDGRFNPWINGGARVPNGLYYGRVEVGGGGGVKDDSLRVIVSLPSFAGHIFDPAVTPNPPLRGVQLRVYGPSGSFTAVTGADGSYSLPGLGAGAYRLNLSLADYVDAVVDMTLNAAGDATAFTARSVGVAVSSNATGGLDVFLSRAPRLIVVPSIDPLISAEAFDQWGSLQVRSSTGANSNTIYGPMRLKSGTTTFDDGGQWDPSTQQFVEKTLLAFNVTVGTYSVVADVSGYSRSTGTVFVGASGARLDLPAFTRKTVVTGQVFVSPNLYGTNVSVVAVPLTTAAVESGFANVYLNPGTTSAVYTMGGLDAGSYMLRANAQGLSAVSLGPVTLPASGTLAGQDFPVFGAGASIFGTVTIAGSPSVLDGTALYMNAWAPGSFNFGSTVVYTVAGSAAYAMLGLDASATYQLYVNVQNNGGKSEYDIPGGFPKLVWPSATAQNFTLSQASGVVAGTIHLQAGASDFLSVELYGRTLAALRPERVGQTFVEVSTALPGFSCGGLPASNPSSSPAAGYCPLNMSSATFLVTGVNTETLELSFLHKTSGQSSKQILSIVNGATVTFAADLSSQTFSISGSIVNQITGAMFNTNAKIVANAPLIAPTGYPAAISSTTARVSAVRQDIDSFGVAISTVFSPLTSRVGFLNTAGGFIIPNVPKGVYFVRTTDLRSCATCAVLVPSVGKVVSVAGASVSSVTLTLSDGYSVSGSLSLDDDIQDAQIFDVSVVNRRQEVVSSLVVYLGDLNSGVVANTVDYAFTNLPAGEFYTLSVRGRNFPVKYAGRPIRFPDAALSPNGLQSSLTGQNVLLRRAAYIVGRFKDGGTGEMIRAANATLLAPNFGIKATANPWTEGGFVTAASSMSARPIEGDGYFRVGPLLPDISYDLRLAQATWDPNFLAAGSQNYAPVTISGLKPTPGEIRDVGVIALGQGQSVTGVVRSTATGQALGNIKVTARPSFGGDVDLVVQTFTNSQGAYSLWVSSAVSNQFSLVAAPRDGNLASDGLYYRQVSLRNVNLQTQTTADFLLTPLLVVVTGQIVVADAATGGVLSYPFGDKRGFPAAAVNLKPAGTVSNNPLGDIEVTTDERGVFSVPGLSTGIYVLHATSLGYAVYNATVEVVGASFSIFTGSNTATAGVLTLVRGATVTGRILKSDGTAPNSTEIVGVAAANFSAGEFVAGSVETDAAAKTVSAYTISGFKIGIAYDIVLLSGASGKEVSFPPEGAGVLFSASQSTATMTFNLTYRPATLDCLATAKALDAARSRFLVQVDCLKPLRQESAADDDLAAILTVSTFTQAGAALVSPNGTGALNSHSNSTNRRRLTAIYTLAANEARFSLRIRASAAEVDPRTGDHFSIDKVFDFYAGLDASADGRVTNIDGGVVEMSPSAQDELLGLDERSRIDLPPGAFGEGSDSLADASVVALTTTAVNVSMTKGRDQKLAKALSLSVRGYAPAALEVADVQSAFPAEMWAAMSTYRTQASTTQVGGANPISAFYSIFLPAGIRHQLKQRADLTLSYSLVASTGTADDKIQIWFYNATLGRFVPETTNRRLDTVNKTVTVSVDHFSTFVVLDSTPVLTIGASFGGNDIAVANFPNPADCISHSNIAINSTLFGGAGTHAPFVGTMLRASIPLSGTAADLRYNIYTVAGMKIRTIEQGSVPAGQTYYTPWDCRNDSGQTVASGVYIGEVVHGGRRKFFKIAIIRGSGL